MLLHKDLFIIPQNQNLNIIYAPTRRYAFFANDESSALVQKYLQQIAFTPSELASPVVQYLQQLEKITPLLPTPNISVAQQNLVVILSQMCNLACNYCFAQEGRSKEVLAKEKLQMAIDYIFAHDRKDTSHYFSFIGGGEPTVTWELLEWAIAYIKTYKRAKPPKISLTTNGTLLTPQRVKFLKESNVSVGLSFDILPDIQDTQRPFYKSQRSSFTAVEASIKFLTKYNLPFSFRSTITKKYVAEMEKMVSFVHTHYPNIRRLHLEAVSNPQDNDARYYQDYYEHFFRARQLGNILGIDVFNSITHSVDRIRNQFCKGEFCIVPTGEIFACHRIASMKEKNGELFWRGTLEENLLTKRDTINIFQTGNEQCTRCFARWHCAGGCLYDKLNLSAEQLSSKCQLVRNLVAGILRERLLNK